MKYIKLYLHTTDGGAMYLMDNHVTCPNGEEEGILVGSQYVIRIDGDLNKEGTELVIIDPENE